VVRLQLQAGAQQWDRLVVTAGLQVLVDGGTGRHLPRLGLPGHLDLPVGKGHIHPPASFPVGVLEVGGDCLAERVAALVPRGLWQQGQIKAVLWH